MSFCNFIPERKYSVDLNAIVGKRDNLDGNDWLKFATYCELPEKAALRILRKQVSVLDRAGQLIDRCFLPTDQKEHYRQLILDRSSVLAGDTRR